MLSLVCYLWCVLYGVLSLVCCLWCVIFAVLYLLCYIRCVIFAVLSLLSLLLFSLLLLTFVVAVAVAIIISPVLYTRYDLTGNKETCEKPDKHTQRFIKKMLGHENLAHKKKHLDLKTNKQTNKHILCTLYIDILLKKKKK